MLAIRALKNKMLQFWAKRAVEKLLNILSCPKAKLSKTCLLHGSALRYLRLAMQALLVVPSVGEMLAEGGNVSAVVEANAGYNCPIIQDVGFSSLA